MASYQSPLSTKYPISDQRHSGAVDTDRDRDSPTVDSYHTAIVDNLEHSTTSDVPQTSSTTKEAQAIHKEIQACGDSLGSPAPPSNSGKDRHAQQKDRVEPVRLAPVPILAIGEIEPGWKCCERRDLNPPWWADCYKCGHERCEECKEARWK